MVVTRKTPALPTPTSRTNSQQPIPRIKKQTSNETGPVSSPLANSTVANELSGVSQPDRAPSTNTAESPSKKVKTRGKGKKNGPPRRVSGGFLELLTRAFLLFFTIYTLSVCPTDEHLKSPVCRGLHEYRRLILEPYLLPPIQQVLAHPAIAPYVDRAKPYANRFVVTAKPIALRTQQEWNARVVPQWNKRVVPQWYNHAVPAWNKYAIPQIERLEQQMNPFFRTLSSGYEHRVAPHLRITVYNLQKWRMQAYPYVLLAAQKTSIGYQKAKPYAIPVVQRMKSLLADLIQFLVVQRRQFVDPHLTRIWEGVVELSGGKPATAVPRVKTPVAIKGSRVVHATPSTSAASSVIPSLIPSPSMLPKAYDPAARTSSSVLPNTSISFEALPATITAVFEEVPESAEYAPAAASLATEAASSVLSEVTVASLPAADSTSSIAAAPSSASSLISSLPDDYTVSSGTTLVKEPVASPLSSVSSRSSAAALYSGGAASSPVAHAPVSVADAVVSPSIVRDQAHASASSVASVASDALRDTIAIPSVAEEEDDIDLNAFYAELGLDKEDESTPTLSDFVPAPEETETEEEKAEKLRLRQIETAEKRADITSRHTKWEQQLEEAIADGRKALRKELVSTRKTATSALKESKEIRQEVEALVVEAEKFLRGAEKYLANLKRESRRPDEKKTMWERVVEKIDGKFEERLSQTEAIVNGWYNDVLNQELAEVQKISDAVRDIADRAQADIGLDYAWLDDVTYQDWQRYHDLVRTSENFTQLALSIQNGSHPSPPINPVLPALADLQAEVQDVVVGFETRLRRVKRNGDRAFGPVQISEDEEHEFDASADETVSIPPIQQGEKKDSVPDQSPVDIHQVVIGRSKEEVVAALNRAAEVDPSATSIPEDRAKDAEEVVGSLAAEVEQEVATSAPRHEEL